MQTSKPFFVVSSLVLAMSAQASGFSHNDVRSVAMGGTGVASAKAASAGLFNPAMLSAQHSDDNFQLAVGAGVRFHDKGEMLDVIDALQTRIDDYDALVTSLQNTPPQTDIFDDRLVTLATSAAELQQDLETINGSVIGIEPGAHFGFGIASKGLGVGIFANANIEVVLGPSFGPNDLTLLSTVQADFADGIANTGETSYSESFVRQNSDSAVAIQTVAVGEAGVALSHEFSFGPMAVAIGVAPKKVTLTSYDYAEKIADFDSNNTDADAFKREDSYTDADVGAVLRLGPGSQWQIGVTAKNLNGKEVTTVLDRPLKVERQLRAGLAHVGDNFNLAFDVDLAEYDSLDGRRQQRYAGVGGEIDIWLVQLRGGYRKNLADTDEKPALSAGLGLGPVDVAVVKSDTELGGFVRLAFGW